LAELCEACGVAYKLPVFEPTPLPPVVGPCDGPGPLSGDCPPVFKRPRPPIEIEPTPIPGPKPGPGIIKAPFPWILLVPERTVNIGGSGLYAR